MTIHSMRCQEQKPINFFGVGVSGNQGKLKGGFDDWRHAYVSNGSASTPEEGLGASGAPALDQRMFSYFGT